MSATPGRAEPTVYGSDANVPLRDVVSAFAAVPGDGRLCGPGVRSVDSDPVGHFQGMGVYRDRWVILTHSTALYSAGWFAVWDMRTGKATSYPISTPGHMRHPGGLQVIGDYLVAGIEPTAQLSLPALVRIYDLRDIERAGPRLVPQPQIEVAGRSAAAVGITKVGGRHMLAVYGSDPCGEIYFYWSNGRPLGDPELTFRTGDPVLHFRADVHGHRTGYDNLALLTSAAGELFLLGLRGDKAGSLAVKDTADLWRIDPSGGKAELAVTSGHRTSG
ncbi:hypothetical protein [Kibdelosporangium phytohabitans]|nr:hypothetical protein [Kibdelosporangium phytohabitans]MBE1468946.1 hypothetical protein [Kibdelosporangium phytohabitans]